MQAGADQEPRWTQRILVVVNLLGFAASALVFGGATSLTYRTDSMPTVIVSGIIAALCLANALYIHKTAAAPFAWWKRFVSAWRAARDT